MFWLLTQVKTYLKDILSYESHFTLNGIINLLDCCYLAYSKPHTGKIFRSVHQKRTYGMLWNDLETWVLWDWPYFTMVLSLASHICRCLRHMYGIKLNSVVCTFNRLESSHCWLESSLVVREWLDQNFTDR